jgi:hypothetical protein
MSRPSSESGRVMAWMGNGLVMPVRASAATIGPGTPRLAKVGPIWGTAGWLWRSEPAATGCSMDRTVKIPLSDQGVAVMSGSHQIRGNQSA